VPHDGRGRVRADVALEAYMPEAPHLTTEVRDSTGCDCATCSPHLVCLRARPLRSPLTFAPVPRGCFSAPFVSTGDVVAAGAGANARTRALREQQRLGRQLNQRL
jgi:hypothetical protein